MSDTKDIKDIELEQFISRRLTKMELVELRKAKGLSPSAVRLS